MMAEYIKREDAIGIVEEIRNDHESRRYSNPFTMIIDSIEGVPAADVVEVVRCKDCFNRTKSGMCIQWSRYEKIVNTPDYAFCSWGVKTDG